MAATSSGKPCAPYNHSFVERGRTRAKRPRPVGATQHADHIHSRSASHLDEEYGFAQYIRSAKLQLPRTATTSPTTTTATATAAKSIQSVCVPCQREAARTAIHVHEQRHWWALPTRSPELLTHKFSTLRGRERRRYPPYGSSRLPARSVNTSRTRTRIDARGSIEFISVAIFEQRARVSLSTIAGATAFFLRHSRGRRRIGGAPEGSIDLSTKCVQEQPRGVGPRTPFDQSFQHAETARLVRRRQEGGNGRVTPRAKPGYCARHHDIDENLQEVCEVEIKRLEMPPPS